AAGPHHVRDVPRLLAAGGRQRPRRLRDQPRPPLRGRPRRLRARLGRDHRDRQRGPAARDRAAEGGGGGGAEGQRQRPARRRPPRGRDDRRIPAADLPRRGGRRQTPLRGRLPAARLPGAPHPHHRERGRAARAHPGTVPQRRLRRRGRPGGHADAVSVWCPRADRQRGHPSGRRAGDPAYPDPMPALLALDLGTTSAKAALIDLEGRTLATADAEHPSRHTPDGGSEQEPATWVRAARTAVGRVLPHTAGIAALCLTGQMQDLVLEGERGAIRPAVLYSDLRAAAEAEEIRAALAADGQDWDGLTGNLQDASSCAAMFRRLSRTETAATAATRGITFGPAGHLAHALGAGLRCDLTTAAATGLLDARTRDWSRDIAHAAGIDLALLPRLTSQLGEIVGRT